MKIATLLSVVVIAELISPFFLEKLRPLKQTPFYFFTKWLLLFLGVFIAMMVASGNKPPFIYVAF